MVNVRFIRGGVSGSSQAWMIFHFSINHHPKYKNTGLYFQTDKQEEIFKNLKIRNYLNISLDYCYGFTYWLDGLLLLLIVITYQASEI